MNIHQDFEGFLKLLNAERVEYIIVGGYAVAFHGYVRATNDLDLFFRNTAENIQKICCALEAFGLPVVESSVETFSQRGLSFDEVW